MVRLCVVVLFAFLISSASADTHIRFPSFPPDDNSMAALGDAEHNPTRQSYILNPGARTNWSVGSCGAVVYAKTVRIQNVGTGRVASFSSSYTFNFTTHGVRQQMSINPSVGSLFTFAFLKVRPMAALREVALKLGEAGACKRSEYRSENPILTYTGCAVHIDTDYNPSHHLDPSNTFIRVIRNLNYEYDVPAYTHNLCGNDTHCEYFGSGRVFAFWMDYESSSQTLEFRIANGSDPKPLQPVLRIPNYVFPKALGDDVYLTFWGSSDVTHFEEHELLSWSFFSSEVPDSKLQMLLHHLKLRTWVRVTTGVLFGTVVAFVILWFVSSFGTPSSNYSALGYSTGPRVFSYKELRKATENFAERNVLGRGGSGVVYKGSSEGGGVQFAVKQINVLESKQAESLFHAEVTSLGQIRHRNVVRLHGWCQEKGHLLLVYDYLSNGNLSDWLHNSGGQHVALPLRMRRSILEGVAAALEYLHEDFLSCVLHRDVKSSNVLLDVDFNPFVGDFGLARLMDHQKFDKTTLAAGTLGYMAPELPYTGKATKESDVYSFGVLMLEVICGRRPLDMLATEPEDIVLLQKVWRCHEAGSLLTVADPQVFETFPSPSPNTDHMEEAKCATEYPSELSDTSDSTHCESPRPIVVDFNIEVQKATVVSLLQLGLLACLPNPKSRPSMREMNRILEQIRDIENESCVAPIVLPSLPATKPVGLFHSLEFSLRKNSSSSTAPSPI